MLNLMKSYLCHHFCFLPRLCWQNACSVCQMRVPGLPGQKGEKGSPGVQGVEGMLGEKVKLTLQHGRAIKRRYYKHIYLTMLLCITNAQLCIFS